MQNSLAKFRSFPERELLFHNNSPVILHYSLATTILMKSLSFLPVCFPMDALPLKNLFNEMAGSKSSKKRPTMEILSKHFGYYKINKIQRCQPLEIRFWIMSHPPQPPQNPQTKTLNWTRENQNQVKFHKNTTILEKRTQYFFLIWR